MAELEAEPGSPVFFHDYHLYLAPRFVRSRVPDAALSHFVHIPWPSPTTGVFCPSRSAERSTTGCSRTTSSAFYTDHWRRNFLRSCADILGAEHLLDGSTEYDDRRIYVTSRPISVDPAEFDELAGSEEVREREDGLVASRPERDDLRVDQTDPSKNIVRGFRAFERFLTDRPEYHGRVAMLALLDPSRQDIPEYAEYLGAISERPASSTIASSGKAGLDRPRIADDFAVRGRLQYDVLLVNGSSTA